MFTNRILLHRASGRPPDFVTTGAASFKRLLGCALIMIARDLPCTAARAPRHRSRTVMKMRWPAGPTLGSSHLDRPRPPRDLHYPAAQLAKELTCRMRVVSRN